MVDKNDWRLRGQEEYIKGIKFQFISFSSKSEHAHCEFCWHKFMEKSDEIKDCSSEGFCSLDKRFWVCTECFEDFREPFLWEL